MCTNTITIKKSKLIKLYNGADAKVRSLLDCLVDDKSIFGKITDRIKSFEDACEALDIDSDDVCFHDRPSTKDEKADNAFIKLRIIAKALNEGWEPDWTNSSEYKYCPWFEYKKGQGFVFVFCDFWGSGTGVGSRLCFRSSELALYAGTQFQELYNDLFTL